MTEQEIELVCTKIIKKFTERDATVCELTDNFLNEEMARVINEEPKVGKDYYEKIVSLSILARCMTRAYKVMAESIVE